ncbi:MAG: hypothetical protein WBY88_07430 [Desulfosarcina sp.]
MTQNPVSLDKKIALIGQAAVFKGISEDPQRENGSPLLPLPTLNFLLYDACHIQCGSNHL